ncbi:hypothetical protein Tdes44962_MAKER10226 [Teratosphaeria destructans]|uniref:Uncharacterized protein n=1 Tax=Teratosphaeria destructans TaxID=418781 RepID=A0A9W7W014_9PEZI|nr:hypothetical protein Tdes44962_MAKER10226 [Teratosphaeria destructans]
MARLPLVRDLRVTVRKSGVSAATKMVRGCALGTASMKGRIRFCSLQVRNRAAAASVEVCKQTANCMSSGDSDRPGRWIWSDQSCVFWVDVWTGDIPAIGYSDRAAVRSPKTLTRPGRPDHRSRRRASRQVAPRS